ncbi:MAG: phytanoyl-CoA dioxygenase family protein [Acidiferrobacterales bacterium]|nr:phytanoyl-CoA dioxygenase family protein [Acidiferrobacterales bacterium]
MDGAVTTQSGGNQTTVDWRKNGVPDVDLLSVPSVPVADELIEKYREDGAVLIPGLFSDWVSQLRNGLQRNLDAPNDYAFPCESIPAGTPGRFFDSYCNWMLIPEYFDHVTKSCAASVAGQLMRSDESQFFHDHAFCKEPGTQAATPWHQDMPYYCVDGKQTVSLYVALDKTPAEVAVRFVKGSHLWNRLFHPVSFLDGEDFESAEKHLEAAPDVNQDHGDFEVLAWDLQPGDCIAFHFLTLHGTTAGKIKARRRAVSTRWLGDDVTYCERAIETSPPFPDIGLEPGQRMRTDWFPVLWRRG